MGEDTFRTGLRDEDASRLVKRLVGRPVAGAGEAARSRRNGTVDDGRGVCPGMDDFRYELGVVALRGLKLCPVSRDTVLVLAFHLGRLGTVDGCGTRDTREAGVGVTANPVGLGMDVFRPVKLAAAGGRPEVRRALDTVERLVALPTELSRRLEPPRGVDAPLYPLPLSTTDDAGELPGVSTALPVAGLSMVMMLEIESRRCWPLTI